MSATRYLLVKYIADLQRFEPRNIGVIVCSPEGAETAILGRVRRPARRGRPVGFPVL